MNAPLDAAQKKIGVGEFPSVVYPKPIRGGSPDFLLEEPVEIHRDLGNIASLRRNRGAGVNDPSGQADSADTDLGEQCARALGEACCQWRGGG